MSQYIELGSPGRLRVFGEINGIHPVSYRHHDEKGAIEAAVGYVAEIPINDRLTGEVESKIGLLDNGGSHAFVEAALKRRVGENLYVKLVARTEELRTKRSSPLGSNGRTIVVDRAVGISAHKAF